MTRAPIAWGLWNPATGKLDHRCYQREEAARAGAAHQSNRWRTFVAVPLFLHRDEEGANAQLMAATTAMAEALAKIAAGKTVQQNGHTEVVDRDDAMEVAQAALAQAIGEGK